MSNDYKVEMFIGAALFGIFATMFVAGTLDSYWTTQLGAICVQSGGEWIKNDCLRP